MKRTVVLGLLSALLLFFAVPLVVSADDSVTITGEVIDTFCFALKGARGDGHRQCGIDCVKAGIPAGLLEDGTGKVYVLLPNAPKSPVPAGVIDLMAKKISITGKVFAAGGSQFLTVESFK